MPRSSTQRHIVNASRLAFTAALVATATAGIIAPTAAGAASAEAKLLSVVADSSTLRTPIAAQGVFETTAGAPVPGAQIMMMAWPTSADGAAVGSTGTLRALGRAVTASNGGYVLRIDPAASLAGVVTPDGEINVMILGENGLIQSQTNTTVSASAALLSSTNSVDPPAVSGSAVAKPGAVKVWAQPHLQKATDVSRPSTRLASPTQPAVHPGTVAIAVANLGGSATKIVNTVQLGTSGLGPAAAGGAAAPADPGPPGLDGYCQWKVLNNYGPRWAIVGQTYSSTTGVRHSFSYERSASSAIEVGVTVDTAGYASMSSGGTVSKDSTATLIYPSWGNHTYKYYETSWVWERYKIYDCLYGRGHWSTETMASPVLSR
jgi:hypothetical protein